MVDSEENEDEDQIMLITRDKQHCLRREIGADNKIEGLSSITGAESKDSGNDYNNNDNNNNNNGNNGNRDETPLAEQAAVAKVIVRSLGKEEGVVEARLEVGPSDNQ